MPQEKSDPQTARNLIRDELYLDGNAAQNVATFCTTYDDDDVRYLMDMSVNKNLIDKDEDPQSAEIENRCVCMLAALWNAPRATRAMRCSTEGSSEACMLRGLAMKWRWRAGRRARGAPPGRGWQVPAYPLPANRQDTTVQRILIRHGFSRGLARLLVTDIERSAAALSHGSRTSQPGFHHT